MNSKELMKKLELARVGNGTQTYNDMCLILNKEETLELLQYIEQLERGNQVLMNKALELSAKLTKYKKALDILTHKKVYIYGIKYSSSVKQYNIIIVGTEFDELTQEEFELLKSFLEEE